MSRFFIIVPLSWFLFGCGSFGAGFRDEGIRQGVDLAATAVRDKFDGRFDELEHAIGAIPEKIQFPEEDATKNSLGYTLGALAAYILGSLGKGFIRMKTGKAGSREA